MGTTLNEDLSQRKSRRKLPKLEWNLSLSRKESLLGYTLVLPALLVVLLIVLFPIFWNIVLSFQPVRMRDLGNMDLLNFSQLTLNNFTTGLDRKFWIGLRVTLIYAFFGTSLSILLGLWAALIARKEFRGHNLFRAFILLPYVIPVVSSAFIWRFMLDKHIGIINQVWQFFGANPIAWLTTRSVQLNLLGNTIDFPLALTTIILFEGWRYFPFAFLFILARMQAIPETLYEAARIDGASPLQQLRHITLPQLRTAITVLFLLRFIWTFYKFDDVFLLNGGTAGTSILSIQIYSWLFARRNIGVAAAIGVILAALLIILAALFQRWNSLKESP
ncbi:sugar ABC transporter permease [bacterium]|nr:sugar ABC transporter permease [bacterium]